MCSSDLGEPGAGPGAELFPADQRPDHKHMPISRQRLEVEKVKKSESGMVLDPLVVHPDDSIGLVLDSMLEYHISGMPVVDDGQLVGIVTNRDVRFVTDMNTKVSEVMTSKNLVTVPVGISQEEAKRILHENRIEKLLVVDKDNTLKGLLTIKDIEKVRKYPNSCKDSFGRLRVGAAVGISKGNMERVEAMLQAGADVLVLDSVFLNRRMI